MAECWKGVFKYGIVITDLLKPWAIKVIEEWMEEEASRLKRLVCGEWWNPQEKQVVMVKVGREGQSPVQW